MDHAFKKIKIAIIEALMIAFTNFEKLFVMELGATQLGIGGIVSQERCHVAFFN